MARMVFRGALVAMAVSAVAGSAPDCEEGGDPECFHEPAQSLNMLQRRTRSIIASVAPAMKPNDVHKCSVGDTVECPGSPSIMCVPGNCCPGIPESGGKTFPCPSAAHGASKCEVNRKVQDCLAPCLCTFDIDRTLTGKQGDITDCPNDDELPVMDTAYGGGNLTLSVVGQSFENTFCAGCYVGIVTAGDASGDQSDERQVLIDKLKQAGKLLSTTWSGPSKFKEARANCSDADIDSTLVVGCLDETKQYAVEGIVEWLKKSQGVKIPEDRVWHFDDRANNVEPFSSTGFNARQVSCATREGPIGLCGAISAEITDAAGVNLCPGEQLGAEASPASMTRP